MRQSSEACMHGATIDTVSIRFVSYNKMWTAIASSHLSAQLSVSNLLSTHVTFYTVLRKN